MFSLTDHITIDAPADAAWEVVAGRFDRIGEWATAVPSSAALPATATGTPPVTSAPVPGRVCRTGIALLPEATETIVEYDEADRMLTYEAGGLPAFVTQARNRWQVTALGPHRCRVEFQAQLQVRGLLGRLARRWLLARVRHIGRHLLADLRHVVEHGVPSPRKQRQLATLAPHRSQPASGPPDRLLRAALAANAGFSAAAGAVLVAGAIPVAGWLGIPTWLSIAVGVGLLPFAVEVARTARRPRRPAVRQVIAADVAWVIAAAVILVGFPQAMSTAGLWALGLVTVAVADFAALQAFGLRRWAVSA